MEKEILKGAVIIGGSAGSIPPLLYILKHLSPQFSLPVIIVIHRNNDPKSSLDAVLDQSSLMPVKEAEDKEPILNGHVYVAPADYHLLVEKDHTFSLDGSEKVNFSRPSIDVSMQTAAEAFSAGLLAVILSGANDDGTSGLASIKGNGGTIIVQHPGEATAAVMPESAIKNKLADKILRVSEMPACLYQFQKNLVL